MTNKHKSALVAAFVLASTSAVFAQSAPVQHEQFVRAAPAYTYASGPYAYTGNFLQPTFTQDGASRESFGGY